VCPHSRVRFLFSIPPPPTSAHSISQLATGEPSSASLPISACELCVRRWDPASEVRGGVQETIRDFKESPVHRCDGCPTLADAMRDTHTHTHTLNLRAQWLVVAGPRQTRGPFEGHSETRQHLYITNITHHCSPRLACVVAHTRTHTHTHIHRHNLFCEASFYDYVVNIRNKEETHSWLPQLQ